MVKGNLKIRPSPIQDTGLFPPGCFEQVSSTVSHLPMPQKEVHKLCDGRNCGEDHSIHLCSSQQEARDDTDAIDQIDKLIDWVSNMSTEPVISPAPTQTITGKSVSKVHPYHLKPLPPLPPPSPTSPIPSSPTSQALPTPSSPSSSKPAFRPTIASWNPPLSPLSISFDDIPTLPPSPLLVVRHPPVEWDDLPPFSDTLKHLVTCMRLLQRPLTPTELEPFSPFHREAHDYLTRTKALRSALIAQAQREQDPAQTEHIFKELEDELNRPHHLREWARIEQMIDNQLADFI